MGANKIEVLHHAVAKKERRARRKVEEQRTGSPVDKADLALIKAGAQPSRLWSGSYFQPTSQQSDVYCAAARRDFLRALDRTVLDATIAAGLELNHPHPPKIQLSFAIVRRARLYGGITTADLEEVVRWSINAANRRIAEWNSEDVLLIRATAAFLVRTDNPLESSYIKDLEYLRSDSSDPYLRIEARLVLAQYYLEEAAQGQPKDGRGFLNRNATAVSQLFGGFERGPRREDVRQILEEIQGDEVYGCVTLSRSRVWLAHSWLERGEAANALRALDPRRSAPDWPEDHNQDTHGTDSTLNVEAIDNLVQEGTASEVRSRRRNAYKRALDIAELLRTPEPADILRLARLLHAISRTDAKSTSSSRADHLLDHLCPDPTKKSVSPELAMLMHHHYLTKYLSSPKVRYISNAYSYIDAAFKKLPEGAIGKLAIAHEWLRTTYTYTGATSLETEINIFPVLDYMDQFLATVPTDDPRRIQYLSNMGMALSRAHEHGDHSDRLVGYWEEHLKLVRRTMPTPEQLAGALANAAVSLKIRSRKHSDPRDLAKAVDLSKQAFDLVGYSDDLTQPLIFSSILNEWSEFEGSPDDRREAIRIQTESLHHFKAKRSMHRGVKTARPPESRIGEIPGLLLMTFPVSRAESAECSDSLRWLHKACLDDDYADLMTSLSKAAVSCQFALASRDWDYPSSIAAKALNRVEQTLTSVENPKYALYYIQGLSSIGAVALTHQNSPAKAVAMLERGAALRARIQLERQPHNKTQVITDAKAEDIRPRTTSRRFQSVHEIKGLAAKLDGPLVYLAATAQTGLALIVTPQQCRAVWLPELTTTNVDHWLDLTAADKSLSEESRGILVRGGRGEDSPRRAAVDEVITAATAALAPLQRFLTAGQHQNAHIIPVGQTAGIPWTYAITQPVTINPSATLLDRSSARRPSGGARVSITSPSPCHYGGEPLPLLEKAIEEGAWLAEHVGFDNTATGPAATRNAFTQALTAGPEILHIAAHGHVNTKSWGDVAHLLWADNPETKTAETTALRDLKNLNATNVGTVFLAACWGGAPNRTLPDESISFPTAFLAAGAKSVIAPLWPIDDDVAYEFVMAFYEFWKLDDTNPATALKHAATEIRDAHPGSSTWAAFMLTGHT